MNDRQDDRRSASSLSVEAPASARDFVAQLRQLQASYRELGHNEGCVACEDCRACRASTFCRRSARLTRCHYCVSCEDCADCAHCLRSRGLLRCQHCVDSERCVSSSYLVQCFDVTDSAYCFGCVGLVGADFHLLNQPYARADYFALTRQLLAELDR